MQPRFNRQRVAVVRWRLLVTILTLVLLMLVVVGRLLQLQFDDRAFLKKQGDSRSMRTMRMPAYRGQIIDRNGRFLAESMPAVDLEANPRVLAEAGPKKLAQLAELLEMSPGKLQARLAKHARKHFMYVARGLEPDKASAVEALEIAGLWESNIYKRHYPNGAVTAQLVGLTGRDEQGQEGLELAFNKQLSGEQGRKTVVRDLKKKVIKDLGIEKMPKDGEALELSLDLRVQYEAHQTLTAAAQEHQAKTGSLVALDIQTGEVLAVANYPSTDPNNRKTLDPAGLRNRAVTDFYDPGSTLKTFTVLAGLESGKFSPSSQIDTKKGYVKVGPKLIKDARAYGVLDLAGILMHSSNVGITKVALGMESEEQISVLHKFGFGESPDLNLPAESAGSVPDLFIKREVDRAALSYGYGISTSVMQLAKAYAILARGGKDLDLSIRKRDAAIDGEQVVSERSAVQVVQMLEAVLSDDGTGKGARVPGYRVAGKTGTARKLINGRYDSKRYLSWFAGIAPVSQPRYVVVVMLNDPGGKRIHGGEIAAPVFAVVMESLLHLNGILPDAMLAQYE